MNRRIRQVLPTAPSPTRQILTFILSGSIIYPGSVAGVALGSDYKGIPTPLSPRITANPLASRSLAVMPDGLGEDLEGLVHIAARLRGSQEVLRVQDGAHPGEFVGGHDHAFRKVGLVPEEDDGDIPHLFSDHLNPVVQVVERVLP